MAKITHSLRLWHILALFLLLGGWTSVVVPLGEGPDELPHFTVTRYIVQHVRLPESAAEHESFQPPLYYLLSAAATFWIDSGDFVVKADADYDPFAADAPKTLLLHTRAEWFPWQGWALAWHLMRLLSLTMGAVSVAAIGATAAAATGDARLGLAAAALTAFLPGFIFMAALVSNDNLAAMLAALLCWRIALLLRPTAGRLRAANGTAARGTGGPTPAGRLRAASGTPTSASEQLRAAPPVMRRDRSRGTGAATPADDETQPLPMRAALLLGLLLGLALMSKTSMLAFIPTLGLALLFAKAMQRWTWPAWLRVNLLVFGLTLLLSGWYFARNFLLYGDWLAWPLVLAANEVRTAPLVLRDWLHVGGQAYRSFWLEWIGIALDPAVQLVLALISLLALAGLARGLIAPMKRGPAPPRGFAAGHAEALPRFALLSVFGLHCFVIGVSWLRWTQTVAGTGQARLFYPALPVISLALVLGWRAIHPRLPLLVAGLLLLLAAGMPLRYLAPAYAPAPRIAALPAAAQPISATFKDKLRLIGWQLPAGRVHPGQTLYVALYWEALKDLSEDDWLKLQLLDARDQFIAFKDGSPSAGRDSTDAWRAGERVASWHRLPVPASTAPGVYRLTAGIHPYGRKNWFPIAEENMWIALGDQLVLSEVTVD